MLSYILESDCLPSQYCHFCETVQFFLKTHKAPAYTSMTPFGVEYSGKQLYIISSLALFKPSLFTAKYCTQTKQGLTHILFMCVRVCVRACVCVHMSVIVCMQYRCMICDCIYCKLIQEETSRKERKP